MGARSITKRLFRSPRSMGEFRISLSAFAGLGFVARPHGVLAFWTDAPKHHLASLDEIAHLVGSPLLGPLESRLRRVVDTPANLADHMSMVVSATIEALSFRRAYRDDRARLDEQVKVAVDRRETDVLVLPSDVLVDAFRRWMVAASDYGGEASERWRVFLLVSLLSSWAGM